MFYCIIHRICDHCIGCCTKSTKYSNCHDLYFFWCCLRNDPCDMTSMSLFCITICWLRFIIFISFIQRKIYTVFSI